MNRDIRRYFKDQWNVLDALGILCLFVGMVFRWDDSSSPWGPAFYALSAPLVVSRVLFFAQILHFQGPMVQASERPILRCRALFCVGSVALRTHGSRP